MKKIHIFCGWIGTKLIWRVVRRKTHRPNQNACYKLMIHFLGVKALLCFQVHVLCGQEPNSRVLLQISVTLADRRVQIYNLVHHLLQRDIITMQAKLDLILLRPISISSSCLNTFFCVVCGWMWFKNRYEKGTFSEHIYYSRANNNINFSGGGGGGRPIWPFDEHKNIFTLIMNDIFNLSSENHEESSRSLDLDLFTILVKLHASKS